jgi:hypothetical protein
MVNVNLELKDYLIWADLKQQETKKSKIPRYTNKEWCKSY